MFNNFSIRARLIFIIGAMSVLAISLSAIGLVGIKFSNASLQSVYIDRLVPTNQLSEIKSRQYDSRLKIANSIIFPEETESNLNKIDENVAEINKLWDAYALTYLTPEEKIIADKFIADRKIYRDNALIPALALMKAHDQVGLQKLIVEKIRPLFQPCSEGIDALVNLQLDVSKQEYDTAQQTYNAILIGSIITLFLGLGACLFVDLALIKRFTSAITNAQQTATAIANGDLSSHIVINSEDEISVLLRAMQTMQTNLKTLVTETEQIVNAAVKGDFSTKINLADKRGFSKDVSEALNKLSDITDTGLRDVMRVADALSKGDLTQKMTNDYKGLFGLTAKGVNGTVDSLIKIVNEIQNMVDAATKGEFSYKMNLNDKAGYTKAIAELLNKLSNVTEDGLNDMLRMTNALADGDLTISITKEYPGIFGQVILGMNNTAESLKVFMAEIRETSDTIASVAKEISAGNNDLSHRTEEQAASLEETAASMHELTSTVEQNTANAKQANELAVGATEIANKGVTVVEQVVSTMENINESSLRIVDIISVIDDIAFQTNILALNAAVEAARAGEQGKGFAVVATEVRNLAQRAANAAGEIKRLIGDSVERVSGGSKQVAEAGQTMQDIVEAITSVTKIISEIANASIEQSSGISQVGQAIGSMDEVTQQNAALVEQVAATAESLESQTGHLAKEMAHFKTDNNSNNRSNIKTFSAPKSTPVPKSSPTMETKSSPVFEPKSKVDTGSKGSFSVGADDWEEF